MPDSPMLNAGNVISLKILINGTEIDDSVAIVSVEVDRSLYSIATAKVIIALPIHANDSFELSESNDFAPGQEIEIKLGYEEKNETVFKGIIANMGIRNLSQESNEMVLRCSDKAVIMTLGRKSAYYNDQKDSAIISSIVGDYSLSSDVDATTVTHKQMVKYQSNDWDFLINRAEANGLLVYTEDGKILAKKPLESGSPDLSLTFGLDVLNFDCGMDAQFQSPHGRVNFIGNAKPKLNTLIKLNGFGKRFNQDALITSVQHKVTAGTWQTSIGFGLATAWNYQRRDVIAPPAAGLIPSFSGLQNGTVKKIDADPDGQFRILVAVPVIEPNGAGIWARMAHFYATAGKGSFFLPEIGDEVILGFVNDDPRFPIILGMLYSRAKSPAYTPENQNKIKAIVTKNDLRLEFNDADKILTINTPGGNKFTLSDKDKSVTVKDQNGNNVEMTSAGITMNSAKDIVIKARGKIDMQATSGISIAASGGDLSLEGLNVNAKAKIAFSAQGTATAELKAAGTTIVKGAMVMIN